MKNFVILFLLIPLSAFGQKNHFEGIIRFNVVYSATTPGINADEYTAYYGDHYISYIKPGFYRQDYPNAKGIEVVFYNYLTNLYYFKLPQIDTLYTIDCSVPLSEESTEYADSTITLLGHKCKSILQSDPRMKSLYFYTEDLYIDPIFYINHKMGGYNQFTALSKSVYLKIISDMGDVKCITTADSIVEKKLNDSMFLLPKLPIKKAR
jgi:hypothetical protein